MARKYAIRIYDYSKNTSRLFAVIGESYQDYVKFRELARRSIEIGSSEQISVTQWVSEGEFRDQNEWMNYPAGNLF